MIRATRPAAMAQDDAAMVAGWNISPNVAYTLQLNPGGSACGVLLYNDDLTAIIASGAGLVGTDQPVILYPYSGQAIGMIDADFGWHLLLTTDGTESPRTIRIGPAVDLPDEIHPIYGDDDLAVVRATAGVNASAHYIDDLTVTCPLGLGAGIGDIVSVPVDGVAVVGQVESITWTATPDGTPEQAVIRRHVAIAPEPHVAPVPITPPTVADDAGETDAATEISGNVLTNDDDDLTVVAVNGLLSNVGIAVAGNNGGTFTVDADGAWTFDPDGDFDLLEGSETADTFVTYYASNGVAEASATLTVTVCSAGEPALWTPAEISTMWWPDASHESSSGASLFDRSGNARHAAQSTLANQPAKNGNYLTFDGSNDFIVAPAFTISQATSLFVVLRPHTVAGDRTVFNQQNTNTKIPWQHYIASNGRIVDWSAGASASGVVANLPFQFAEIQSSINITDIWRDGNAGTRGTNSTGYVSNLAISIGRYQASGGLGYFDGDFYEAVLVAGAVSVDLRQKIEGYLAHKWDALLGVTTLVSALPSGHLYKSAPPTV